MHRMFLTAAFAAALSFLPFAAGALSTDREQPIDIEASSLEADDKKKLTIYRGNVVITQGTLRLRGDTVIIHYDQDNDLTKLVTIGKPARFRQLPDGKEDIDGNYQRARADRMEYIKSDDVIKLRGNAVYGEGTTKLAAPYIEYDSLNGRLRANSVKTSSGNVIRRDGNRIKMRILPKKDKAPGKKASGN